jgi:integrase
MDVTTRTMQAYVDARAADVGTETIRKEIGTFASIWNKWGVPQGMVKLPAPTPGLVYPKTDSKAPFQTREQIERQMGKRVMTPEEQAELWECLFLTLPEIDEVLELVRHRKRLPQAYPMLAFAAHTGARRSEIRRALITDFDFDTRTVLIREKKKDREKVETYRTVPMSPLLERVMRDWFANHPGGQHAVCTGAGTPITAHYSTKLIINALKKTRWSVIPGWHCFRHSFVSNCSARGVDQRLIDQWVGHTTEAMRQRYRHLVPAVSQAALFSVFGGVVSGG